MSKALLVGINYKYDPLNKLRGCYNDILRMKKILKTKFSLQDSDIKIISDHDTKCIYPYKRNILSELELLLKNAQEGHDVFFHYSGHGSQVKDKNGDEADGLDETICPVDYNDITDDELNDLVQKNLKPGCRLIAIFDSCHSGSVLDCPCSFGKKIEKDTEPLSSCGQVIVFSGCRDDQTSADAFIGFKYQGALSAALCETLEKSEIGKLSFIELIEKAQEYCKNHDYDQIPQLSFNDSSFDLKEPFDLHY